MKRVLIVVLCIIPMLGMSACLVLSLRPSTGADSAPAANQGDPARGAALFIDLGGGLTPCAACHSVSVSLLPRVGATNGPSMVGVGERAALRIPGISATEYLRASILDPASYIVEGYSNLMYANYAQRLTEQDLADLIAYLLSL